MSGTGRAIVVGIGGAAAGDDAVGLVVAEAVAARGLDARGAADASLVLALLEAGRRVIIVDAVVGGAPAGTVSIVDPLALARGPAPLSSHGLSVADAVAVARALALPALASLSVIGVAIDPPGPTPALALSPPVAAAVERAVDLALHLAGVAGAAAPNHRLVPRIIAHATDLTGADRPAFVHAAALAAVSGARLVSVHGTTPGADAVGMPDAAPLATRWGRPIDHWRVGHRSTDDVAGTVLDGLRAIGPELVVAGTHARHGLAAALEGSVAGSLARHLDVPSLVVPNRGHGFVDEVTGVIDLHRVLVAAADAATAARGLAAARALLALAGVTGAELLVLTVGERALDVPLAGDTRGLHVLGPVDDAILRAARERDACVIVMPTSGEAVDDVFFGSHTEHVIRGAGRAVLTVPP